MLTPVPLIRSGNILSGQVGFPHLASGTVNSGQINTTGTPSATTFLRGDFAWATPGSSLTSGAVGSGIIASGAVQGFFGTTRNIASGTVGVFDFGSGAVIAGAVGSGAIVSANIASGQIGHFHLASGTVNSGQINDAAVVSGSLASGSVSQFALSSGAVNSGQVASGAVTGQAGGGAFCIASGTIGTFDIGSGAVNSGRVASGQISWAHLASGSVNSGDVVSGSIPGFFGPTQAIQSGTVGSFDLGSGAVMVGQLGSGAVRSGNIASGQVSWAHLASGSVNSGDITSGSVAGFFGPVRAIQSGTVGVFDLGSGAVVAGTVGSGAIVSANVASGQISQFALASGAVNSGQINTTGTPSATTFLRGDFTWAVAGGSPTSGTQTLGAVQTTSPYFSGGTQTITTAETISGFRAVSINLSGQLQVAMASLSGRMPAIGVVVDNVLSGIQANVYTSIVCQLTSGLLDGSGYLGQTLFVGRSGQIVTVSGSFNSGGLLSGDITQPVGSVGVNSGQASVEVSAALQLVVAQMTSGNIASGQLGTYHNASGTATTAAMYNAVYESGYNGIPTAETISGLRAVCFNQSGQLVIAMACVSGRMPAIGVVADNALSGIQVTVYTAGLFQATSGMANFSGYIQRSVWVGRSGQIVQMSGSWTSAGFASGDIGQRLGTVANSGAFVLINNTTLWSGGPAGNSVAGLV